MFIPIECDDGFDDCHAGVVTQEHPARDGRRFDTFVTQFAGKAAVAIVDVVGDTSQVPIIIIGRAAIDMVNGHTLRNRFTAPSDIDGTGSNDIIAIAESTTKLQINCLTMFSYPINLIRIYQYFSSVWIDADTENTAYTVVDIEGYSGLGVDAYELHED